MIGPPECWRWVLVVFPRGKQRPSRKDKRKWKAQPPLPRAKKLCQSYHRIHHNQL